MLGLPVKHAGVAWNYNRVLSRHTHAYIVWLLLTEQQAHLLLVGVLQDKRAPHD